MDGVLGLFCEASAAWAAGEQLATLGALSVAVHVPRDDGPALARAWGVPADLLDACAGADVGLYETSPRYLRRHLRRWALGEPTPGVGSLYLCRRRSDLSAEEYHARWEHSHGPKALRHHTGMWDYEQVSIVTRHHGPEVDGLAVVQWPNDEDLAERFFDSDEGADIIREDAASFTDLANTWRYLMIEHVMVEAPWPVDPMPVTDYRWRDMGAGEALPPPGDDIVRVEQRGDRLDWVATTTASAATVDAVLADLDVRWTR